MAASISLAGKVAVVTGGGRGIGKAIARRLAEAGAGVVIASRKMENLQATAAEFASLPGKVVPIACHVGRLDQLENLVRETESRLGPIDILVNNSATNIGQGPSLDVTDEMLDKMVEVNVKSALRLVRLTVPADDRAEDAAGRSSTSPRSRASSRSPAACSTASPRPG